MKSKRSEKGIRLVWLDIAKGFAILLVLFGHSMRDEMREVSPVLDFLYRLFYIFHMSYFFWLSGHNYCLSRIRGRTPMQIFSRRLKKQALPWMLYTLFIFVTFSIAIMIPTFKGILEEAGYGGMSLSAYLLRALQANNPWAYHLWFLYVLLILTAILCLADGITNGQHTKAVCVGLTILGMFGLAIQPLLFLGEWWRLFNYISLYLTMVCMGVLMAEWKIPDRVLWVWGGTGLVYMVVRALFFSGFSGNSLSVESPEERFLVYLLADILIPGTMMALNRLFERGWIVRRRVNQEVLQLLGKESMMIYLLHQPFCCAFLGMILYNKMKFHVLLVIAVCITTSIAVPWTVTMLFRKFKSRFTKYNTMG